MGRNFIFLIAIGPWGQMNIAGIAFPIWVKQTEKHSIITGGLEQYANYGIIS